VKSLVDGPIVFADEVEQAADLAEGQPDQALGRASAAQGSVLYLFLTFWGFYPVRWLWLSTGSESPFDLCLMTARKARASIDMVMCRYHAW
jgi:hypothetical protein